MIRSLRPIHLMLAGVTLTTLTACGPKIRFSDSVDWEFDLRLSRIYDDRLHGPYVAGASFTIYVYDDDNDNDLNGWRLESQNPEVLEIVEQYVDEDDIDDTDRSRDESDLIVAKVHAAGEGTAVLEVYDDRGEFVRATEVQVMQPDRIELRAAGPLFVNREGEVVPSLADSTPKLLSAGTATFLVEWWKGEQRLNGAGTLGAVSLDEGIDAPWTRQSYLDEDRDWLTLTAAAGISAADEVVAPIEVYANGLLVQMVDFSVVGPDAITRVEVRGESESGASEDELLVALAQAFDDNDESIWGVAFDWDIDGYKEPGEGDLFRYWFRKGAWSTLGAEYNGVRAEAQIQGTEGFVDSSNDIGCFCNAEPKAPGREIAFGLLGLAAFGLVRRRRF